MKSMLVYIDTIVVLLCEWDMSSIKFRSIFQAGSKYTHPPPPQPLFIAIEDQEM